MEDLKQGKIEGKVCVTGAAGFIGSFVVRDLLGEGCDVVATVRDHRDTARFAHLVKMQKEINKGSLTVVSADLSASGSFDKAIAGCTYVIHTAATVKFTAKDAQREIIDVNIAGTKNVLESIRKAGTVRKLVYTSSIAAVVHSQTGPNHVFSEKDWNIDPLQRSNPYSFSKTEAEKYVWDYVTKLPEAERFKVVCINPSMVIGPYFAKHHLQSSLSIIRDIYSGKYPACPDLHFCWVDVRDVSRAHVNALIREDLEGRFILSKHEAWLKDIARMIKTGFPKSKASPRRLPHWLSYLVAVFDPRVPLTFLRQMLGKPQHIDGSKAQQELRIEYHSLEDSILATCGCFP